MQGELEFMQDILVIYVAGYLIKLANGIDCS